MDKSELKRVAIDALSESGALYQSGRYKDALDKANEAWNAYYKLQKVRSVDEDFSDLIYAARSQYEKCKRAIEENAQGRTKEDEYAEAMQLKKDGENGNHEAAIRAAAWFASAENWPFLDDRGVTEHLTYASNLYQTVLNNTGIWIEYRALAASKLGYMLLLPKYGNVHMKNAFECFRWAADNMLVLEKPTDWLLQQSVEGAVETAMYLGDVKTASMYAQKAVQKGMDMGIFFHIAYYGLRHNQSTAKQLVEAMVEDGVWQGLLLKSINLFWECQESDWENEKLLNQLTNIVDNDLSKYYDENPDTIGGNACMAFCIFKMFLFEGLPFLENELMDYLRQGVEEGHIWCYNYYGQICDLAATLHQEEGDYALEKKMKEEAMKYLCMAANNGNREALKHYYRNLVEQNEDASLVEMYKNVAIQYDIKI